MDRSKDLILGKIRVGNFRLRRFMARTIVVTLIISLFLPINAMAQKRLTMYPADPEYIGDDPLARSWNWSFIDSSNPLFRNDSSIKVSDKISPTTVFWENFELFAIPDYLPPGVITHDRLHFSAPPGNNQLDLGEGPGLESSGFSVGAGYRFERGGLLFGPHARANFFQSRLEGRSDGVGIGYDIPGFHLPEGIDREEFMSFSTTLGGRAAYVIRTNLAFLIPYMRFEWEHEFGNGPDKLSGKPGKSMVYGADSSASDSLEFLFIPNDGQDRDFFNFGMGMSAYFPYGILAFLEYEAILGLKNLDNQKISAGFQFAF